MQRRGRFPCRNRQQTRCYHAVSNNVREHRHLPWHSQVTGSPRRNFLLLFSFAFNPSVPYGKFTKRGSYNLISVLTTLQYTSSTSTVTVTGGTTTYTFGDTAIETARNFGKNYIYSNSFTTSIRATVMQISYYSGISQSVRVGIYSDSSGSPSVKLAETSLDSVSAGAWHNFVISYSPPAGKCWLAFTFSGTGPGDV